MASRLLKTTDKVPVRIDLPLDFYHRAFDRLGYSKTVTEKRIKINDNYAACLTRVAQRNCDEGLQVLVAGSRGEGMAVSLGSDIDVLYIQPALKCFETFELASSINTARDVASFQLDLANAPVGYTKLRLITIKEMPNLTDPKKHTFLLERLSGALTEQNGYQYLRNDHRLLSQIGNECTDFRSEGWVGNEQQFDKRNGPAQPHRILLPFGDMYLSVDYVSAFPCYYPSAYADWCKRERPYAWPSKEVIDTAKELEVLVVPAGEPGSNDILNWRISFTNAVRSIVQSFNDTQIKVYAALKMLAKHHLKTKCSAISSYVVKNSLLWVFESNPSNFAEKDFVELVSHTLQYLKDCVNRDTLKNYMSPSRNMLKNRITDTEKAKLLECLETMIVEGPAVILRCPLVKQMFNFLEDDVAIERRIVLRDLTDQILLCFLSLPPDIHDRVEFTLCKAQTGEETILLFIREVFPVIRNSNPFEYFNRFVSMGDLEIQAWFAETLPDWMIWADFVTAEDCA